jgi:hypothetical protein
MAGKCKSTCVDDADCDAFEYCETTTGQCRPAECFEDPDCDPGMVCLDHHCVPEGELSCPDDMVPIRNRFCMDIWEASRPDATESQFGTDESIATNRPSVMPWYTRRLDPAVARAACQAAGKRLCALDEWITSCRGQADTDYAYGDDFDPVICNSIDTYCVCEEPSPCAGEDPCPFPHCYDVCGANLRPEPTGSFPGCVNSWGIFDLNGNVWELADSDDGQLHFRGGAFNCIDSEALHRCDHDGTWGPSAQGFRCCSDGERGEP